MDPDKKSRVNAWCVQKSAWLAQARFGRAVQIAAARLLNSLCALVAVVCAGAAEVTSGGSADARPSVFERSVASPLSQRYLAPTRLVWQSAAGVRNAENLLKAKHGQAVLAESLPPCVLTGQANAPAGLLLDFGVEINGSVELFTPLTPSKDPVRVRVRFGESVSEAMAELGAKNAQNDHAVRDEIVTLPWLGKISVGPSGFRFVRIDAADPARPVSLTQVRAVLTIRDLPYIGSFQCDDERLNRIWQVGAYTVHLNMQDYLWDGIKRDRLVWLGDMHPEVRTIQAVFGFNEVVPRSLDLIRDVTPPTEWMNGISSYSMWWVLIHEDLWLHQGDRVYLEKQKPYLQQLLTKLARYADPQGREKLDGNRFLDWPTSENKPAIHAGLQALLVMTLEAGDRLMTTLQDAGTATQCRDAAATLRQHVPPDGGAKQAAALLSLAGLRDPKDVSDKVLKANGPRGLSTFYGYYVLRALAASGDYDTALEFISRYWGAMLDFGATTFWEDFDLAWTENAARIDELVPPGKKDLHGDCGAYCYEGFRHSFCHGWASGPTAWLSEFVLGIRPIEPGCKTVRVAPELGRLKWVEGTYPTPQGPIRVRHTRRSDGSVQSEIQAPEGVKVLRDLGQP